MLVLTRKKSQTIVIGDPGGREPPLVITVLEIAGGRVRIGFTTTSGIPIHRGETCNRNVANSADPDGAGDAGGIRAGSCGTPAGSSLLLPMVCLPASSVPRTMHDVIAAARTRLSHADTAVVLVAAHNGKPSHAVEDTTPASQGRMAASHG
jgi:carbon storage regulator CsrA